MTDRGMARCRMGRFEYELQQARDSRTRSDLLAAGVSRRALAGAAYERSSRGFHRRAQRTSPTTSRATTATPSTTQRIVDALTVLPSGALVAGWAAAYVHGIDVLDGRDHLTMSPLPVPILLPPGMRRRSTAGIYYRQTSRPPAGEVLYDVPVTSLWRTIVDLARWAPDLTEAVVAVDAFLTSRTVTRAALGRQVAAAPSRRGIGQVRDAVEWSRVGVRGPWESRLRMLAVLELGLVGLQPNRAVFGQRGEFLGAPDLLDAEAGLAIEYDGASWQAERAHGHRDRRQHREDNVREERLERAGLIVVRADKADLTHHRSGLTERLRTAYADGVSRDRSRDRWTLTEPTTWYGLPA